jgi:chromosome segregation ATPase
MDIPLIITAVTGGIAAISTYFVARYKSKNDSFNSIIKANESFREEIRRDLIQSRVELEAASEVMATLRNEIDKLRHDLNLATAEIKTLSDSLSQTKDEREEVRLLLIKSKDEQESMRAELMGSIEAREALMLRITAADVEILRLNHLVDKYETQLRSLGQL